MQQAEVEPQDVVPCVELDQVLLLTHVINRFESDSVVEGAGQTVYIT
jgi:hypothetical protein